MSNNTRFPRSSKPSYRELLEHPLWQKKRRLIVFVREATCEECGATDIPLDVHHTFYKYGRAPWEYPNDSLQCLCRTCHRYKHEPELAANPSRPVEHISTAMICVLDKLAEKVKRCRTAS